MAAAERTGERGVDARFASLIRSEKTVKILTILTERVASPKGISTQLGLSISLVSHHVKKLERMGLVELVEERDAGGAIEHFYRAVVRPFIGDEEWQKLDAVERRRISTWVVQLILADAARSLEASLFEARPNTHLSRTPMVVDRQGFDEVAEIQGRALEEIIEVQARSAERLVTGEEAATNLLAAMMCFELPEGVRSVKIEDIPSTLPSLWICKSS